MTENTAALGQQANGLLRGRWANGGGWAITGGVMQQVRQSCRTTLLEIQAASGQKQPDDTGPEPEER
ncbi:hypothetical protein J6590_078615 [Homalodisca vitripennis]|nr:hypothetical protein J6590_078615 [Homalodisca vitripennis]